MRLALVLLAGTVGAAPSYPIPAQPLRKLFVEADLVVVAVSGKTVPVPPVKDVWENAAVELSIRKVLKGDCGVKTVKVFYCPGMV